MALRNGNGDGRDARRFALALAVSMALHTLLVFSLRSPVGVQPPAAAPPLIARLARPPVPETPAVPPAPPPVIKDTLEPPRAEPLDDYIKPQPRRVITDKPQPQPKTPKPIPPKPQVAPRPPERPPPAAQDLPASPPPAAAAPETPPPRRSLDLAIPPETRPRGAERLSPQELNETLTRLSETMLYPSEALRRGLQGEVVIVVELGEGGRIIDADIASGSGHALLDEAAVRAVRRLGSLGPSTAYRTILLPVRFRIL